MTQLVDDDVDFFATEDKVEPRNDNATSTFCSGETMNATASISPKKTVPLKTNKKNNKHHATHKTNTTADWTTGVLGDDLSRTGPHKHYYYSDNSDIDFRIDGQPILFKQVDLTKVKLLPAAELVAQYKQQLQGTIAMLRKGAESSKAGAMAASPEFAHCQ